MSNRIVRPDKDWHRMTPEEHEAYVYKRSVAEKTYALPHWEGDMVVVWAGNNNSEPAYLGRVKEVWAHCPFNPSHYLDWAYKIEHPSGKVDGPVNEDFVFSKGALEVLEDRIELERDHIEHSKQLIRWYERAKKWAKDGETGFLNQEHQHGKSKKTAQTG